MKPGIYDDMPSAEYHADPCDEPSLSAGIMKKLLARSPRHAWQEHPRLNPQHRGRKAANMDFGTAAHAALLEGRDVAEEVVGFDDWRTSYAKLERDAVRSRGKIPLLSKDYARLVEFTRAVKTQLEGADIKPEPLSNGKPEQTLVWQDNGVWCRARVDWLHDSHLYLDDLKTTATSANPHTWSRRRLFDDGYDVQCAHYLRGVKVLTDNDAAWRFVVAETDPPFAVAVISLDPFAREAAERKRQRALAIWKECLSHGTAPGFWPTYTKQLAYAEQPAWDAMAFEMQHEGGEAA